MNKKRKAFGEIPQEISANLQAPELAPSDKRFTGRTKQLNFKVREEFYWQLKNRAVEEKCMLVEVLERAFAEHVKGKANHHCQPSDKKLESEFSQKDKQKAIPQLNRFIKTSYTCDQCQREFERSIVYSLAPNLDQLKNYPTYCVNCAEVLEKALQCYENHRNN